MLVGLVAGLAEVVVIYFIAKHQAASMARETPERPLLRARQPLSPLCARLSKQRTGNLL